MDDRSPDARGASLTFPVQQGRPDSAGELPPGFVPLRLVLLPNGVTLELDRPDMTLGRHSGADLRLPMPDVSRRHCRFTWSGGTWAVSDLASLNGVYVNGRAVQKSELNQNDLVRIGGFSFAVDLSYPDPPKVKAAAAGRPHGVIRAVSQAARLARRRMAS
jgi:pSer/pThr/pTyr-binding forkhead associated (FHA) protein